MKGTYVLILRLLKNKTIHVGALGEINFRRGYYAYVGSAMGGIEARIERHLRKEKKMRWHIDYLRKEADIVEIWYMEGMKEECRIAGIFNKRFPSIPNFGSTDCRCKSHLFYAAEIKKFHEVLKEEMKRME